MARATRAARNNCGADSQANALPPEPGRKAKPDPDIKGKRSRKAVRVQSTASPASNMGAILEALEDSSPKKTRRVLQLDLDQGPINNLLPDEVRRLEQVVDSISSPGRIIKYAFLAY
jgi:hypothetical protein